MEKFRAWIVISIFIILILYFCRNVIKRLIFIIIVLGIAFFVYGLFSPTGADKLRYNIKNIPTMVASFFGGEDFISYEEFKGELGIDLENDQTEDQKEKEEKSDEENEVIIGKRFAFHYVNAKSFIDSKIPTTVKDFNEIKDNTQTETNQNKTTDTVSTQNGTINVNNTSTTTSNSSSNNSSNNNSTQTTSTTITNSNGLTQAEINETKRLFDIIEGKSSPSQYSSYSSNDKDKVSESLNQLLELLDA